jgi:predicted metal-dependent hydrolase
MKRLALPSIPAELLPVEALRLRVQYWSGRLRAQPREIVVMRMTRKWASCSARGRICLSRDLLSQSSQAQDYVVVHELLHLRHPNHGQVFRALIRTFLPERTIRLAEQSLGTGSRVKITGLNGRSF